MSIEVVCDGPYALCSPLVDKQNNIYVGCLASGLLLKVQPDPQDPKKATLVPMIETGGVPTGVAVDPISGDMFVADQSRQSIVKVEPGEQEGELQMATFIDQFEGRLLRGPNRLCFDHEGEMYFTDSGAMGDTGLSNPKGCVFRTVQGKQQVIQLIGPSLCYPSGIHYSKADGMLYVCEMSSNRVLRFVQRPVGVFHGSVFAQLSGTLGPVDVVVNPVTKDVYVAQHDYHENTSTGVIHVFLPTGEMKGSITLPGAEITGICIDNSAKYLYITEQSEKKLYRMPL